MRTLIGLSSRYKPEAVTVGSTDNWREWWREESARAGSDWEGVSWTHISALYAVRSLCESSAAA